MARTMERTPAWIEMRVPQITRASTSRPRSSVPRRWAPEAGLRMARGEARLDDQPPDPRHDEDLLRHHRAADQGAHLEPEDGDDGDEAVTHAVTEHHPPGPEPLAVGGPDVVGAEHLDHAVADLAEEDAGESRAQDHGGHQEVAKVGEGGLEEPDP